ncbi:hypothetical protein ACJJTC_016125 [Scirpophaga incertulas]
MKYEDLLRTLDLEEFKEAFHDNNIDDESVLLLGDAELKELIPKIGPRLKFKKLLDELKLEAAQDVTLTNEDALWCNITKTGSETYTDKSSDDVTCAADEPSHTPVAGQGDQNTGCLDGRAVIIEGEASGGLLKEGSRRKLSLILINETIKNQPDYKISSEQFQKLASGIVTTFPKESTVVYYSPYVAGKDNTAKKKFKWKTLRKLHYKKTKVAAEWRISWYKQTSFIVFFRKHISN